MVTGMTRPPRWNRAQLNKRRRMSHDAPADLQHKKLWQQVDQFTQRRLTRSVVIRVQASVARALDIGEIVVHEEGLCWRDAQPLSGKLINARVRLHQPLLTREDK